MTAAPSQLPTTKDIRDLVSALLGRDVTASFGAPVPATLDDPAVVAVYVDDRLHMYGVLVVDVPLAASCAAALALLPPHVAELAATSNALTDALCENIREIANIMTSLLAGSAAPHLRLYQVYEPGARLPADVAALVAMFGARADVRLSISGYGDGCLSFVLS